MSRCFPFPPPGYEKKARPDDDANFLIKEKNKEKKHKKDKKDKENKEKREKKDKESSREKRDRKRKHKDKDKKKEKEEKDSEEKKDIGSSSHQNDEKFLPIRIQDLQENKIISSSSHQNGEKFVPAGIQVDPTQHGRILLGLENRVGNQNGAREILSVDKGCAKEIGAKSSGKELESSLGVMVEGDQKFKDNREGNRAPNGHNLKFSAKHLENGFLGNILAKEQKVGGAVCQEVSEKRKDKNKHKNSDSRRDKHKDGDSGGKSRSKDKKKKKEKMKEEKVKEVSTPVQSKLIENGNNAVDIQNDRRSCLFKGSHSNSGNLGKRKEPEMNGFVHGNDSPINKLPRPLSKHEQNGSRNDTSNPGVRFSLEREAAVAKHKLDPKASCSSSVSENGAKLHNRQTANNYAPERQEAINSRHDKASESLSSLQPSLGIGRKLEHRQTAMNFASKEQAMVTNHKLNKKVVSSKLIAENGRKIESSQPSTFSSVEMQRAFSKSKLDDQESRINGLGVRKPDACSKGLSPVADQLKETVEKHPHPDAKYLSRILSVPEVQWSDNDDQMWLFAMEGHRRKKPKIDSAMFEESKQVWAEALQLESADVTALPYVIPY